MKQTLFICSPLRLTIELRDGSRVVGTSVEQYFLFHSALFGELKLEVKDIRSVECVSSNLVKLATASGDSLTVSFVDAGFAVKTGFGKINLAADSLRKLTVTAAGRSGSHPPGLVALWSGEDNGRDSVGGNDAKLMDIDFTDGQVGRALSPAEIEAVCKNENDGELPPVPTPNFTMPFNGISREIFQ